MEIQDAVEKILKVSPSVRVVSVCDLKVHLLVSKKQSLASLKAAAKDWKQRRKLARTLGPCAGKNHILYVTTTAAFDHNKVIRKVRSFR
jgi:ACT domain-containing protein